MCCTHSVFRTKVEAGCNGVGEMIKESGLGPMYEISIGNSFGLAGWTGQAIFMYVAVGLALYLTTEDEKE